VTGPYTQMGSTANGGGSSSGSPGFGSWRGNEGADCCHFHRAFPGSSPQDDVHSRKRPAGLWFKTGGAYAYIRNIKRDQSEMGSVRSPTSTLRKSRAKKAPWAIGSLLERGDRDGCKQEKDGLCAGSARLWPRAGNPVMAWAPEGLRLRGRQGGDGGHWNFCRGRPAPSNTGDSQGEAAPSRLACQRRNRALRDSSSHWICPSSCYP